MRILEKRVKALKTGDRVILYFGSKVANYDGISGSHHATIGGDFHSFDEKSGEITLVDQVQKRDLTGYVTEPTYTNIKYIVALTIVKRHL